jgi:hypothetical protein
MENENVEQTMTQLAERLAAAAVQLERAIAGMEERHAHVCGDVQRIVATAEGAFGELLAQAQASATATVRKTMTAQMISKRGVETVSSVEAGALDAALSGLSLEQRIAVKSQLARAGVLG